jgi:hypothetical protein
MLGPRRDHHFDAGASKRPSWRGTEGTVQFFARHAADLCHGSSLGTFLDSFYYLDTLGVLSEHNHSVFGRQTLVGGQYELLRCTGGQFDGAGCDFEPNPDYWVATCGENWSIRAPLRSRSTFLSPPFPSPMICVCTHTVPARKDPGRWSSCGAI